MTAGETRTVIPVGGESGYHVVVGRGVGSKPRESSSGVRPAGSGDGPGDARPCVGGTA
ncbi:hypothetical protein [Agromyces humi]|uniref:hypothetical protein n=1 Tax=Agromyces humi TaxID=1766800 RepID=UPI00135C0308|nr:hypothetical protein [Agromyces humi]